MTITEAVAMAGKGGEVRRSSWNASVNGFRIPHEGDPQVIAHLSDMIADDWVVVGEQASAGDAVFIDGISDPCEVLCTHDGLAWVKSLRDPRITHEVLLKAVRKIRSSEVG